MGKVKAKRPRKVAIHKHKNVKKPDSKIQEIEDKALKSFGKYEREHKRFRFK
jgi:hypothetical protein